MVIIFIIDGLDIMNTKPSPSTTFELRDEEQLGESDERKHFVTLGGSPSCLDSARERDSQPCFAHVKFTNTLVLVQI